MKIAVIGAGISGLSAAWLLSRQHEVTLFEKNATLGGHAHTAYVKKDGKEIPVDTGFMVFNPLKYPNLVQLFKHFDVTSMPTSMSFSVSIDDGAFEFSSNMPGGVFADKENVIRSSFYDFLIEINRFNDIAHKELKNGVSPHKTLEKFLDEHGFSEDLREKYIFPLVGSIWTTPKKLARDFPCGALLTFLNNHHLLATVGHPQWQTVAGGSSTYVDQVAKEIQENGGKIVRNARLKPVIREGNHVRIVNREAEHQFDYVVFATHADETLALLKTPTREERLLLSKFSYETNDVYLHADETLMPRRKDAWAAWNYLGYTGWGRKTKKVCLTYNMNILQSIDETPVYVTINPYRKPSKMYKKYMYSHPLYTCEAIEAQPRLKELQGKQKSLFCGSYFGYGFHEDGIVSAIEAVKYLDIAPPWETTSI